MRRRVGFDPPTPRMPPKHHKITNAEQKPPAKLSAQSPCRKPIPPNPRQHPPRHRHPTRIHLLPHHPHRRLHPNRHHLPQNRRLNRQRPTHRPQHPRRLGRRRQQSLHLRMLQHRPKLRPKPRRLPRSQPNQPPKLQRQHPSAPSPRHPNNVPSPNHLRPSPTPPQPPRLKPRRHPLHPQADLAQPPMQQQRQSRPQHPTPTPSRNRLTQRAEHNAKAHKRGWGQRRIHVLFLSHQGTSRNQKPQTTARIGSSPQRQASGSFLKKNPKTSYPNAGAIASANRAIPAAVGCNNGSGGRSNPS